MKKLIHISAGLVVTPTDKILKQKESEQQRGHQDENLDELDEEGNEIGSSDASATTRILENQGSFDNLMIWEHEKVPGTDDVFVKGVQEWIQFAEAVSYNMSSYLCFIQKEKKGKV